MRIIAGKHRGRELARFRGQDIRPTADRVKESLFQILSLRLVGARVLDLFCGSGALGLEALSRGAKCAVFNDISRESIALLKKNLSALGEEGEIHTQDFSACLKTVTGKFDLIFADPPYRENFTEEILRLVAERGLLKADGLVIVESEREEAAVQGWEIADLRSYGRTKVAMFRRTASSSLTGADKPAEANS